MDDYVSKPVRPEELQRALEATEARVLAAAMPVAATPQRPPAVDVQVLATLRELQEPGEPDFVIELVDHFLEETPIRLAGMARAIAAGEAQDLNRLSHSLKASCGTLGALHMSSLCATLEHAGAEAHLEDTGTTLDAARAEFERVKSALLAERDGRGVENDAVA